MSPPRPTRRTHPPEPAGADARYATVLSALQARGRYGIRLGLGRTRALLKAMGSPDLVLRGPLIGGTNGKGSVQAIVAACLAAAGYRVGQTPKPHLVSYRERILVEGRPISPGDFAGLVGEVLAAADRIAPRSGPPTEFEVLTVAALTWFARRNVEVAVVEVGLGGRLDATNVWDGGVAAVTNVQFDHMAQLGPDLATIGREKAAIIKPGDLAVTGAEGDGLAAIRRRARRLGVHLEEVAPLAVRGMDRHGLWLHDDALGDFRLALLGRHQAANAAVALAVLRALGRAGLADVPAAAVRAGCAAVRWPGRLELLRSRTGPGAGVEVVLDGAHNAAGAAALAAALDEIRPSLAPGRPTLLLAMMADKQIAQVVGALAGSAALRGAQVVTTAVDVPRALDAAALAAAWGSVAATAAEPIASSEAALAQALDAARAAGGPLIVAGSLYLVGEIRGRLLPADRP
ncbi:MAG: bifunctional folylpolyglutamate synthase/dihydrofolate synthase [Candidatus Limnocylindrales bacterium]